MIVDTHVHVIADDEARYPLQPSGQTPPWYREEPCSLERLLGLMDGAGVDRAVLVQAFSAYGFDNRYTADSAQARPDRCTSVACIDVAGDDPVGELRPLIERDGMRGLRWVGLMGESLRQPGALWRAAADLGVPVVLTILADRLPELADTIPGVPSIPLALDHCGFADISEGVPAELAALAAFPNLHLKVSTIMLERAAEHGDTRDFVAELAATFGAGRLMWGSDWSQTHHAPYAEIVEYGREAASKLGDDERSAFLGGTACTIWTEFT
jgi:predicted TIM-barrel fold metal-dependent hydrolase